MLLKLFDEANHKNNVKHNTSTITDIITALYMYLFLICYAHQIKNKAAIGKG